MGKKYQNILYDLKKFQKKKNRTEFLNVKNLLEELKLQTKIRSYQQKYENVRYINILSNLYC